MVGESARQRRQQIALLRERLAQRRQRGLDLRQSGFLQGDVIAVGVAGVELVPQDVEHLGIDGNKFVGGVDLSSQGGLGDGRDHDVRGERQVSRLNLEALVVGQRLQRFDRASVETPNVEGIRHFDLRGMEREDVGARCRDRRQRGGRALVGRIEVGLDQREELTLLSVNLLPGGPQRGDRRLQRRIIVQRALDQRVERGRFEPRPPSRGNVAAFGEALRLAGRCIGRCGARRQRLLGVAGILRRRRMEEIRTDRATRQKHRGGESGGPRVQPPDRRAGHLQPTLLWQLTEKRSNAPPLFRPQPGIISDPAGIGCDQCATLSNIQPRD